MQSKLARLLLFSLLGVWLSGCMDATPPGKTPGDKVVLKLLTSEEILQQIAALKGKTVVVDVWASWCPPCRKEFPNLLILERDYSAQGLVCMSVSVDEAKTHKDALAFLQKEGSSVPNFRVVDGEDWMKRYGIEYIPTILVYQDGKFVKKFDTYDELKPYLRDLLAKKTS